MRIFLTLFALSSFNAFSAWNEVECSGRIENKSFKIEVEEGFPRGWVYRRGELIIFHEGRNEYITLYNLYAHQRSRGFNQVKYSSSDLTLEIDHGPDQQPRWGRSYRGALRARALGNQYIRNLNCRFPNI